MASRMGPTSQSTWSGVERRKGHDATYFEKGGIERRKTPEPQTVWTYPLSGTVEEGNNIKTPPRAIEWFVLVLCILLISLLGWGGIAWLISWLLQS